MATYILKAAASDLTGGTHFTNEMSVGSGTTSNVSYAVAASATEDNLFITQTGIPSNTAWGSGITCSVALNITTANTNITYSVALRRVNATGTTMETSAFSAGQSAGTTGNKAFNMNSITFTGGAATDRLVLVVRAVNAAASSQTVAFQVGGASNTAAPSITEFTSVPGVVTPNAQIQSDFKTLLAQTGNTAADGATNPLMLSSVISANTTQTNLTPKYEIQPNGTAFTGTVTNTAGNFMFHEPNLISARRGGVLAYDSVNKRYINCGGYDGTTRFAETWEITAGADVGKWRLLLPSTATSAPLGKNLGGAVQINNNNKSWFFYWGGSNPSDDGALNILDCTTRGSEAWTLVTQTNAPSTRSYVTQHLVAVNTSATSTDVYLFGGWGTARYNDLYKVTVSTAGAVPTALTWTTLSPSGTAPTIRSGTVVLYDSVNNRLIQVGGYDGTTYLMDTHAYSISGNSWSTLAPTGTVPTGRELHNGQYDATSQRAVFFGGWSAGTSATNRNDIVQLDFSGGVQGVWSTLRTHDYPNTDIFPFSSGACCYDSDRRLIVEFGQNGYDGTDKYLYAFDFRDTVSTTMTLYGLNVTDDYRAGDAPGYCYDSTADNMMVVSGFSGMTSPNDALNASSLNGDHHNDVWAHNVTNNTLRYVNQGSTGMTYKEGTLAVYDSVGDRTLVFGGLTGATQVCNDVWELKRNATGNYKARKLAVSGTKPGVRWLCAGAYDSARNRLVIWSSENSTAMIANTDCWQLDLTSGDGTWSQLTPTGTPPAAVWQPMFAMDNVSHRLYIYSGNNAWGNASTTFSTTIAYLDLTNATPAWTTLTPTGGRGVRGGVMVVDHTNNYLIAFGGFDGTVCTNTLQFLNLASPTAWTTVTATGTAPTARRSCVGYLRSGVMYISRGRPATGTTTWFKDWTSLTPNYTTPSSSAWAVVSPTIQQRQGIRVTGLTTNASYHWQSWFDVTSGTTTSTAKNAYGGSPDFSIGSIAVAASMLSLLGVG